jgi:hypothetical protein
VSNYIDYFQSESCSGHSYSTNERIILILSCLHPIWRGTIQRKYKQLVQKIGQSHAVPLECCQEITSYTLTQWCNKECVELPSVKSSEHPPDCVFALDFPAQDIIDSQSNTNPSILHFGDRAIDATMVDRAIAHAICYVDRKARPDSAYPRCITWELPGHTIDKCHPLVNHCIAQALAA